MEHNHYNQYVSRSLFQTPPTVLLLPRNSWKSSSWATRPLVTPLHSLRALKTHSRPLSILPPLIIFPSCFDARRRRCLSRPPSRRILEWTPRLLLLPLHFGANSHFHTLQWCYKFNQSWLESTIRISNRAKWHLMWSRYEIHLNRTQRSRSSHAAVTASLTLLSGTTVSVYKWGGESSYWPIPVIDHSIP